jgi:hypothetical protein
VLPGCFFIGATTGAMGAGFVAVNSNLGLIRKKLITNPVMKVLEAVVFSVLTTTIFFWLPKFYRNCVTDMNLVSEV